MKFFNKTEKSRTSSDLSGEETITGSPDITLTDFHPSDNRSYRHVFKIFVVDSRVTYINLIAYLLAVFSTICLIVYLTIVQPFVMTLILKKYDAKGSVTGSLALYDEIIALPAILLWGTLSDRVGRRPIYAMGFVFIGAAIMLYSTVKNIYPHMLLCRLLFSLGTSAATCMMTGTLGDVTNGSKLSGRVSALVGMMSGFGALLAALVLINLPYQLEFVAGGEIPGLKMALQLIGGIAVAFGVIFFFTLPNFTHPGGIKTWFKKPTKKVVKPSLFQNFKYGILAGRDPRIALAYASSFVARADTVLFSTYMTLWVAQYYVDLGYCQSVEGKSCAAATGATETLTGMAQGISLAFAPFYGFASEKLNKPMVLGVAGVIGTIGCFPFAFTTAPPDHQSNHVFINFVAIGQIGMIVTGMSLVNGPFIKPEYRGSVAGAFSFCGAISIMIMAKLGGYLFDVWMRGAPFVLMGISHVLITLFSFYVRTQTPRLERQDQELMAKEREEEAEAARARGELSDVADLKGDKSEIDAI